MAAGVVIAGAGQAGFQAAVSLRAEGYTGPVTLVGEEPGLPYQRPPLSKGCLHGKQDLDEIDLRPAAFYEKQNITLRMGERILAINRDSQSVGLADGEGLDYDYLLLATGASNRHLAGPGALYLRTREEADALLAQLEQAERLVVVGGGFIGLEVAAAAAALERQVTVVEPQPRLMQRAVGPVISEYFRALHARHGVDIVLGEGCTEITADGAVQLTNGNLLPADIVVAGIGVVPRTGLAESAGLSVANGIVVDEYLRTADERIYAIGDCAAYPSPYAEGLVRLESVQNAVDQARCFAASVCGNPKPYTAVPWFWTDQFEAKLQTAGISRGFDCEVTRGDLAGGKFSVCYFRGRRLIAIDSVNRPSDHMAARKLITHGAPITPEQAADAEFDLKAAAQYFV